MAKKILFILLGAFLTFVVVVLVRTFQLGDTQIEPQANPQVTWDEDAMIRRFSESVQYQTISGDDGAEMDSTAFYDYLDFLRVSFPRVHNTLEDTLFNDLTPLYYWEGTDPSLDPVLLMGHYDVVPVDSSDIDGWTYPPFSGIVQDGFIWGRGTMDNKFNVMGLLETAEYLIAEGYQPTRSIYFAFGHDEEIGGDQGARAVSRYLQDNGVFLQTVLDEGGRVVEGAFPLDRPVAMVGIAEKGYLSLELIAKSSGGHSSRPSKQNSVAILSEAIVNLSENQFPARIDGVVEQMFNSFADEMPFSFKIVYANRWLTEGFFRNQLLSDPATAAMIRTTIAPTMVRAGVKENVLPNEARAIVNFRILPGDTFETVTSHVRNVIDDERISIQRYGDIQVLPSSISNVNSSGFESLQQTIMDVMRDVYVAPYLVFGATDSRHFSSISDQVYRFAPMTISTDDLSRMHGTGERVSVESYLNTVRFYSHYIRLNTE
ncbi:MAG: M20 family peptidase [Balneolaceae bacterium]|nr:M20 family peptidase [Balneolaceae bacterium]